MRTFHRQEIKEEGHVGAARRGVRRFASQLGFSDDRLAELDIVVQEIGTNAARYATSGGCLHWAETLGEEPGLELFYADKGPGVYDLERALRDGVSSGGSLGTGFGAMRRLLDEFDAYSTVKGTTRRLTTARRTRGGGSGARRSPPAPSPRTARSARDSPRCASGRTAGRRAPRSSSPPT